MIVKYLSNDVWGYIDNIRQVASQDINVSCNVLKYDEFQSSMPCEGGYKDPAEYGENGNRLSNEIITCNKVFMAATYDTGNLGNNVHSENLIDHNTLGLPISKVLLYLEDVKEHDVIVLVTNQRVYLMNDKGQTIERLV